MYYIVMEKAKRVRVKPYMRGGRIVGESLRYDPRVAQEQPKVELELMCANQQFFGKKKAASMIKKYHQLQKEFPGLVRIKEPEASHPGYLYKEASIFVNPNEVDKFKKLLNERGIQIDIVHEGK